MSVVSRSRTKTIRTNPTRALISGAGRAARIGLSTEEVKTALLRAAYMLHATRVIGWKEGTPAPKKG